MDRITQSMLEEFCTEHALLHIAQDTQFEHFATHAVVSRFQSEAFDTSDLVVGAGNDTGIDAIAIIANGALVTDPETIEDLSQKNGFLDVQFLFVQAERSSSFESAKIGQTGFGVEEFFKDTPRLPRNSAVNAAAEVMVAAFRKSSHFRRGNPTCRIYYVTTGKWTGDQNLEARRAGVVSDLIATNLFRHVDFSLVGADEVQKLYRQTKNAITREFVFDAKTVIPEIRGVKEAYLGLLPGPTFLKLIQDDSGELLKSIFYDNVRDWQDYNVVNTGIRDTITSATLRQQFALMNNGITIIAKEMRATGNRFTIEDYQIVNGCQTSHVLYWPAPQNLLQVL